MTQRIAICRSCGARGVWMVTAVGKPILVELPGISPADLKSSKKLTFSKNDGHVAHFANCAQADQWRRKR